MKETKRERTQKEIVDAAKTIIHDKGHEAITVRNLADLTGYSHTNLYYYFRDLGALLWTLRLDMINDMIAELTTNTSSHEDIFDDILNKFNSYIDYFFSHPNVFRFFYFYPFIQPDGDDSYQNLDQKFNGIWQTSFVRLIQEGIVSTENLEIVAKTIIYAMQGMIMLSFSSGGSSTKKEIKNELERLIKYLFRI
ncbi:MAG: TetR/AcrR family transcriptional regulator [Clostridia bacterium]|nr:TetR/AcrR family transcriptional regulator [Clostridia bacterium]